MADKKDKTNSWINLLKKKEYVASFIILLVTIGITILLLKPYHAEFIATGGISSVEELGIDGSVYFTYVESGLTNNYYERITLEMLYDDMEFIPLDEQDLIAYEYYEEMGDQFKEDTIVNAVESASFDQLADPSSDDFLDRVWEITNSSAQYSGDSFGLMIAIGLVEELNQEDFSKDGTYVIAGTGTMEADHSVGSIGGIRQKLLTAENNGVDIFFIPKDKQYYYDISLSNEVEAEQVIAEEGLDVRVVAVETLEDAIIYLRNLP
ncbi:hypothetical protein GMD78_07640 [Ornithinibacillus sp. L9]|uniref:Lon proteolytic domain-containing protein n=1 Tax=Ornithinibacillus caprae TaxID=2678566 RepID=A0A6N8FGC4_9BACI|nr:S16 family serine protease [Ornithinibacillus caprae]MUK88261.1 hypothetical protein [Ornithinibacillus caprae]